MNLHENLCLCCNKSPSINSHILASFMYDEFKELPNNKHIVRKLEEKKFIATQKEWISPILCEKCDNELMSKYERLFKCNHVDLNKNNYESYLEKFLVSHSFKLLAFHSKNYSNYNYKKYKLSSICLYYYGLSNNELFKSCFEDWRLFILGEKKETKFKHYVFKNYKFLYDTVNFDMQKIDENIFTILHFKNNFYVGLIQGNLDLNYAIKTKESFSNSYYPTYPSFIKKYHNMLYKNLINCAKKPSSLHNIS